MNVTVLGAGAWGTALAHLLSRQNHAVTLWSFSLDELKTIAQTGRNERVLPGIELPKEWRLEPDFGRAIQGSACVVVAVPSKFFRDVTKNLADYRGRVVSVTKGIEYATGLTMCG